MLGKRDPVRDKEIDDSWEKEKKGDFAKSSKIFERLIQKDFENLSETKYTSHSEHFLFLIHPRTKDILTWNSELNDVVCATFGAKMMGLGDLGSVI